MSPRTRPFHLMHISDPHFHRLPRRLADYRSKRALGALNLLLRRGRQFPRGRQEALVHRLQVLDWSHLLITGDLTQLGTAEEFALARTALAPLLERGPQAVTVLPGNHDRYVPEPLAAPGGEATADGTADGTVGGTVGAFEAAFGAFAPTAREHGMLTRRLSEQWWLAAWDSAVPAPWYSAAGRVRAETLAATEAWLAGLPSGARVIVANHYPVFFPAPHRYRRHHDLANQDEVAQWLLEHPVRLYLHGHIHANWVHTVDGRHGPLTCINSASSTQRPRPLDPSALHRITLLGQDFEVQPLRLE